MVWVHKVYNFKRRSCILIMYQITKPTFVGPDFTRRPVKYERFIRPMGLRYKTANTTHPELGVTVQLPILGVKKNPSSPMYTQLGVLTRGKNDPEPNLPKKSSARLLREHVTGQVQPGHSLEISPMCSVHICSYGIYTNEPSDRYNHRSQRQRGKFSETVHDEVRGMLTSYR